MKERERERKRHGVTRASSVATLMQHELATHWHLHSAGQFLSLALRRPGGWLLDIADAMLLPVLCQRLNVHSTFTFTKEVDGAQRLTG